MRSLMTIYLGLLLTSFGPSAWAQQKPTPNKQIPALPVEILSDSLRVLQKQHKAIFQGNVRANQGNLAIRSDSLSVHYLAKTKTAAQDIATMVFEGNVSITQETRKGHCQKAIYDKPKASLTCLGNPWVVDGPNRIHGEEIVYLLGQDEVQIKKPKATILIPEEKQTNNKGARP